MLEANFTTNLALFLLRTVTGILFFFQGYDKIFNIKIKNVVQTFQDPISKSWIPGPFLLPFSWITSIAELTGGILLILGLFREAGLIILSIDLLLAAFAFSSIKAMWDMQFYFPRLIFLLLLLLLPAELDVWNLDSLFSIGRP